MFGTVEIKSRPIKLAYLVEPNNEKQIREAIQLSSTLWGGSYFPIIPMHKRMPATWRDGPLQAPHANKVIQGYLDAFDPDVLVQFSKDVPDFVSKLGLQTIDPDEIWQGIEEGRSLSPRFGIGVFEILNDIYDQHFKYKTKYPVQVTYLSIPRTHSLFWSSVFGDVPEKIDAHIQKHYAEALEIVNSKIDPSKLSQLFKGNILFPRRVTRHALKHENGARFGRDACIYFLDVTKTEDIIDFWNLRAMGREVLPLPKQLIREPDLHELVISFLKHHRRPWRHDAKVCDFASIIRGRGCKMEELQEFTKTLKFERVPGDVSDSPYFGVQHWYPRVWDEWARDKDGAPADIYGNDEDSVDIDSGESKIRFRTIVPKFAERYGGYGSPRCANEIGVRIYGSETPFAEVFPKFNGRHFNRAIAGPASGRGDWRVGRNGLVKLVKYFFNESRTIPQAENVIFSWLKDLGWSPKLSPPGILASQVHSRLGGSSYVLHNETVIKLLERMNGGRSDAEHTTSNSVAPERELAVGEVKSRLQAVSDHQDLHDYLLSKGVFQLGLRTQCPHCQRNSWFPLEGIQQILDCPKCLNTFPAAGNIDRGTWCYKTAGPFSVPNYADGAYGVLLTLDFFSEHRLHSLRKTPVLSFSATAPNKGEIEADLALFWQETLFGGKTDGLLFAECKTYGRFEKRDFDRMKFLAETFPGAILVFSTLRKSLSDKEVSAMSRIAKVGRKYWKAERPRNPVLVLTGTELTDWSGPPYCWDESLQRRFNHLHGLIDICNATQQIYLNLPSWHEDWKRNWENKNKRRRAREAG